MAASSTPQLNWRTDNIKLHSSLAFINWDALKEFASVRSMASTPLAHFPPNLTWAAYTSSDASSLTTAADVAGLRLERPTLESCDRLRTEVDTLAAVKLLSSIPIPQVFSHDCDIKSVGGVGAAIMLMDFIPGNTAMDFFGGPLYKDDERAVEMRLVRREYVKRVKRMEVEKGLDGRLSGVLGDEEVQGLAQAFWLWEDGRIGFYGGVIEGLEERCL